MFYFLRLGELRYLHISGVSLTAVRPNGVLTPREMERLRHYFMVFVFITEILLWN